MGINGLHDLFQSVDPGDDIAEPTCPNTEADSSDIGWDDNISNLWKSTDDGGTNSDYEQFGTHYYDHPENAMVALQDSLSCLLYTSDAADE